MDFAERIVSLGERIQELKQYATTEEATKTSLIMPFLQALGYDTFDPRIVVPEFTSDTGTKKGEKVDYAIMRDGEPIMLIECKTCGDCLDQGKANQLHRYFQNTSARIAILTDGERYKFFSDLDRPNIMDEKPFMEFCFSNIEEPLIPELRKLVNERFDDETMLSAAKDLKYTRQIKSIVADQFQNPSDDFVRIFASQVYSGKLMASVIEDFRSKVQLAIQHHINDVINDRLQGAMSGNSYTAPAEQIDDDTPVEEVPAKSKRKIITTEDEIEGYHIIKAIMREIIAPERVVMRDTQSYCGVLLDDNNRKPICRLHFDGKQKYIGLLDHDKKETRHPIDDLNDIFSFAEQIKQAAIAYDE